MERITVACDSFKGSLSSAEANAAAAAALRELYPTAEVREVSVADGGEGTGAALADALEARSMHITTEDPLGRAVDAVFYVNRRSRTAVIDTAAASGLPLLKASERDPMATSSYGTGRIVAAAIGMGCRNILIGLGGSATNDCGTGFLQALGYRFLDSRGMPLGRGGQILAQAAGIDSRHRLDGLDGIRFTLYTDVDNPLYGPTGAACTFGPQKGADAAMCEALDEGARNFAAMLTANGYDDTSWLDGAGAAGGMGAGLSAVLGAEIRQGAPAILESIGFDDIIFGSDLVITGEGRLDGTTLHGKVPFAVLQAALRQNISTYAIAGSIVDGEALRASGFARMEAIKSEDMPLSEAMEPQRARELIRAAVRRMCEH